MPEYKCDLCEAAPADLVITNVHNGDTLCLCGWCVPAWAEAITQAMGPRPGEVAGPEPAEVPAGDPMIPADTAAAIAPAEAAKGPGGADTPAQAVAAAVGAPGGRKSASTGNGRGRGKVPAKGAAAHD